MTEISIYLICIIAFISAIRLLSAPQTAVKGEYWATIGMLVAIFYAFLNFSHVPYKLIIALFFGALIGFVSGRKIKISALPQMVAVFNGLGGGATVAVAIGEFLTLNSFSFILPISILTGAVTFTGSLIAFGKLQGFILSEINFKTVFNLLNPILALITFSLFAYFIINPEKEYFYILIFFALLLGIALILPINGADMPVVISALNSLSGWASVTIGFVQNNILMISVGTIVGASGTILTCFMAKAMNTALSNFFYVRKTNIQKEREGSLTARSGSPKDAAFIMENSQKIIIVPGFGMAAASAQHALKSMADLLKNKYQVEVKFAIHPVAGRMPGHMNVLLAEANVDYNDIYELEDINRDFATADVAYIIGANDITNPEAQNNPDSPLYGMPVFDVGQAKTVFFVKRTLGSGYSGTDNPLFFAPNTIMLYGDAKKITEEIDKILEQ